MLRQLARWNQNLRYTDTIIWDKDNLQVDSSTSALIAQLCGKLISVKTRQYDQDLEQVSDLRVLIDNSAHITDEPNDALRLCICCESFASKYTHPRHKFGFPFLGTHFLHFLIPIDDAQDVQKLSLIFMNAFDLSDIHGFEESARQDRG